MSDRRRWSVTLAAIVVGLAASASSHAEEQLFDAQTGYRIAHYRSPVPATVPGGTRIALDEFDDLRAHAAALAIDVMPTEGPGLDEATGEWRLSRRHDHVAGSVWLPDVGRGRISETLLAYFRRSLEKLTANDLARPLIFYCQSDCWMAWNAVQRAASFGYTRIYWWPDGIDGWRDDDRPLVPATPHPAAGMNGPDRSLPKDR